MAQVNPAIEWRDHLPVVGVCVTQRVVVGVLQVQASSAMLTRPIYPVVRVFAIRRVVVLVLLVRNVTKIPHR